MKTKLFVGDMTCAHCEAAITDALKELEGVKGFTIDLESKVVEVEFESSIITLSGIIVAINEAGYAVEIA